MARNKRKPARKRSLGTRFKSNPIGTLTAEGKKLGIPKPVTKLILLGIAAGALTPAVAPQLNRIPFMSNFTKYGAQLRAMLKRS